MRTPLYREDLASVKLMPCSFWYNLTCTSPNLPISFPTVKALINDMRLFPGGGRANGSCQNVHPSLSPLFSSLHGFTFV
jgi:hypothetical protein